MKRIQLSDHFRFSTILLFSLPSIGMQIVDNTYQVVDGFFISNYISETAFEAENLIFPALLIVMYVGLMFGTGASALISSGLYLSLSYTMGLYSEKTGKLITENEVL